MWVLGYHIALWMPQSGLGNVPLISHGYLAVDFFFLLSGYILTTAHGSAFRDGFDWNTYFGFLWRRVWRLFPLHWAIVTATLVFLPLYGLPVPWWRYVVGDLLLIHRWNVWPASGTTMNPPDWSISTEWAANIAFPVFMWIYWRGVTVRRSASVFFLSLIGLVFWRHNWSIDAVEARSWLPLLRCMGEFGIGVLLAKRPIPRVLVVGRWADALSNRMLHWLGEVSYSIYLVQIPCILAVREMSRATKSIANPGWIMIAIIFVIVVSSLTYRIIEKPARSIGRHIIIASLPT
jgi:peptidoglycan/LPS O-acetylase OafA/YrhL